MRCAKKGSLDPPLSPILMCVALSRIIAHHSLDMSFTLHLFFNKFLLSIYYVLGTVVSTEGTIVEKVFPKSICL